MVTLLVLITGVAAVVPGSFVALSLLLHISLLTAHKHTLSCSPLNDPL